VNREGAEVTSAGRAFQTRAPADRKCSYRAVQEFRPYMFNRFDRILCVTDKRLRTAICRQHSRSSSRGFASFHVLTDCYSRHAKWTNDTV